MQNQSPKRKPLTPEEIIAQQKHDAALLRGKRQPSMKSTYAPPAETAVAVKPAAPTPATAASDTRTPEQRYIDTIAPTTIAGQLVKFSKEGRFVVSETAEEISPDDTFVALCDETLCGWIRIPRRRYATRPGAGTAVRRLRHAAARKPRRHRRDSFGSQGFPESRAIRGSIRSAWCCRTRRRKRSIPFPHHR